MSDEEKVDEYLHYISRSSTEFYLSGRYKSELYLTPNKLSDSDSDNDDGKKFIPDTDSDPKFSPPPKLALPPHEIELRIEEFLNNFTQNGWGPLEKDNLSLDCSSEAFFGGNDESKQPNSSPKSRPYKRLQRPNSQLLRREGIMVVRAKNSEGKIKQNMFKSWHTNAGGSDFVTEARCVKNVVFEDVKQTKEMKVAGESGSDSCNFRVSWASNESSTPSCPRQSITSPSDNNFFSSSLTSSAVSQIEDELGNDRWSFDFSSNNLDYPDRRARFDLRDGGHEVGPSKKFNCSSVSTSLFGDLSRGSRMPSLAGKAMGESNCMLTILDVANVLQNNFAFVSGGKSRRDFALVSFPECPSNSSVSDDHFKSISSYLASILSPTEQETGVVVVIDRRQDKWASVKTLLIQITSLFPTPVQKVYVLRPLGFLQKTFADTGLKFIKEEFRVKILILDSVDVLHDYIDKEQLTAEFGGTLAFNLPEWIQHRAALEKFSANVASTKQNMLSICRDLQEREFPNDVTQTEVLMHDHETIRVEIEEDIQSTLNHGRVLVECFVGQEGGSSPSVNLNSEEGLRLLPKSKQNHVTSAHRLLAQVEEAAKSFESFWKLHKVKLEQCLQLRKFEEEFKQLQFTCDKHLKYLESLEVNCESSLKANELLVEIKKFEESSKSNIARADALKLRGQKFIEENHYALDCIRPKCSELERIVRDYNQLLDSGIDIASKSKELFHSIENAEKWCSKGVDLLASQAIEPNHSSEQITKAISDLDSMIGGFKNLGFTNPKEFHQKFNSLLGPAQLKTSVESILSRSEDVLNMLTKCRTQLCSQIVIKNSQKPVHVVLPSTGRLSHISPPVVTGDNNNGNGENNGNVLSPFSVSMVNLSTPTTGQAIEQYPQQLNVPSDQPKPKRKFSFKRISKLERKFSKSTHNLDSIKSRLSPSPDKEDNMLKAKQSDAIAEIVAAERLYVDGLQLVMKSYVKEMESIDMLPMLPEELVGRKNELFANWSELFSFHSDVFLKELESAEGMKSVEAFCFSFIIHKDDLTKLYIDFCKNKVASTELLYKVINCDFMKECQKKAASNEPLDVLLSKPIQQLPIYHRLLKDLVKYCNQDQSLESAKEAIDVVGKLIEKSSAAMSLISIEGFEGDLSAGGKLIQQGSFLVQVEGGKSWGFLKNKSGSTRHLFLFETFIIICKKLESNGNGSPTYSFKALLPTADLALTENVKGDKKKFQLSLHKTNESYIVQASGINVKDFWVSEIKRILLGQFEKIKNDNLNKNSFRAPVRSPSKTSRNGFHPLNNNNSNNMNNNDSLPMNDRKVSLSSSTIDLSKVAGQTYVIRRNHSAVRPDELSLKMGTEIILLDPGQEGWSLIREANNPRNEGWIPSNLLVEKKERLTMNGFLKENYSWSHSNESLEQPA